MATLPIDQIIIGERFRKEMGDLNELAENIRAEGLLYPVLINERYELVDGERRIRAFQQLGRTEIDVRQIPIDKIRRSEFSANELRKQFTPLERLAAHEFLEQELRAEFGERRGRPTEILAARPELEKGKTTRDIAAAKTRLGSATTMRRIRTVRDHGDKEVIAKMESGDLSPTDAERLVLSKPKRDREGERRARNLALPPKKGRMKSAKSKKDPTPRRFMEMTIKGIGDQVVTGKFEFIIENRDDIDPFYLENAANTLRLYANKMLAYADELASRVKVLEYVKVSE